jgi:hypothetical protein
MKMDERNQKVRWTIKNRSIAKQIDLFRKKQKTDECRLKTDRSKKQIIMQNKMGILGNNETDR